MKTFFNTFSLCLIILATFITSIVFAQNQSDYWFFGDRAGLHFSGGTVSSISGSQMNTWEGSSVLSDNMGTLRFYTDGRTLYNNLHAIVSTGMNGNSSTSQAAIMLPFDDGTFAVVTTDYISSVNYRPPTSPFFTGENSKNGITLYHFDQTGENNPSPQYLLTDIPPSGHSNQTTEKITAILNSNNDGYWVIGHGHDRNISNNYYAYPISKSNGTIGTQVISVTSLNHYYNGGGHMRASPNCDLLAVTVRDTIELLSINRSNGSLTPFAFLDLRSVMNVNNTADMMAYGIEFSPSGQYLYVSQFRSPNMIIQFDLSSGNQPTIQASGIIIPGTVINGNYQYGALSLGPDGKIYIARDKKAYLSRLDNPDNLNPGFIENAVNLGSGRSGLGLPNFSSCIVNNSTECCESKPSWFLIK